MSHVFLSFTDSQLQIMDKVLAATKARSVKDNVLEIDEDELKLVANLTADVKVFGQNAGVEVGIRNTKELIDTYSNRVYLQYVPYKQQFREQIKQNSKFHFDFAENKFFVLKNDLSDYAVRSLLKHCYNNRAILASDFNGPLTPGKIELARALNCTFDYEKPTLLAQALISCLEENLQGVKGALKDFHDLDRNICLVKEFLPYIREWNQAHDEKSADKRASIMLCKIGKMQQNLAMNEFRNAFADPTFCNQLMVNLSLRNYLYGTRLSLYGQSLNSWFQAGSAFKEFSNCLDELLCKHELTDSEQYYLDKSLSGLFTTLDSIENNFITRNPAEAFDCSLEDLKNFQTALMTEGYLFIEKKPECLLEKASEHSFEKTPLYLLLSTKKFNELNDDSIHFDSLNHAYYVENNKENRKRYASFLPENNLIAEKNISESQDLLGKIGTLLRDNGYSDKVIRSFTLNDKWYYDKEKGKNSRSFRVINPYSKNPLLVLHSFKDESLSKNIPLGEFDRRQTFDAVLEQKRKAKAEEICELQKRTDKGLAITADLQLLKPLNESKGYVSKKGFDPKGLGLLYDENGAFTTRFNPRLSKEDKDLYKKVVYAPLYNANGMILNVQQISDSGEKKFLNGVITKGLFAVCGDFNKLKNSDKVYVAEGIATAASIANHADENSCVVAALTCGNILNTVKSLSEKFPEKSYAIMADLDVMTAAKPLIINGEDKKQFFKNPGVFAALECKKILEYDLPQLQICLPPLRKKDLAEKKSDFNDCFTSNPELCLSSFKSFNESFENQSVNKKKALDLYFKAQSEEEMLYKNRIDKQTTLQEAFLSGVKKEMDERLKEKNSPLGKSL